MSIKTTIARPYAKAAFKVALQEKNIPAWSKLLVSAAQVTSDASAIALLQNPKLTVEQCYSFLEKTCGSTLNEHERNFFKLLAEKKRLLILPEISGFFEQYRAEYEKSINIKITSATPLDAKEVERLSESLKKRLQHDINLECMTDKTLIGGAVIQAGDLVIDGSVREKLARLSAQLLN